MNTNRELLLVRSRDVRDPDLVVGNRTHITRFEWKHLLGDVVQSDFGFHRIGNVWVDVDVSDPVFDAHHETNLRSVRVQDVLSNIILGEFLCAHGGTR